MTPIDENVRESCLKWFGHVQSEEKWVDSSKKGMSIKKLIESMILYRIKWRIHLVDPN